MTGKHQPRKQPQTAAIIAFPLARRTGKIRDVAGKMIAKSTDRGAAYYREQVTDALKAQLDRVGLSVAERDSQLTAFWECVRAEIIRRSYGGSSRPGGTAA